MDSVGTIIFSILFVFVIGFIIYFTIDYLKYKEEIKNKMEQNDVKFSNLFTTDNTILVNNLTSDELLSSLLSFLSSLLPELMYSHFFS